MSEETKAGPWAREAIQRLEAAVSEGRKPHRHDARDLLIPLGLLILEEAPEADALAARVREVTEPWGDAWRDAVASEQALACAEHIHSADPRYLALSNYDWAYTRAARHRLEARLRAAEALGLPADETLRQGVSRADAELSRQAPPGDATGPESGFSAPEKRG